MVLMSMRAILVHEGALSSVLKSFEAISGWSTSRTSFSAPGLPERRLEILKKSPMQV